MSASESSNSVIINMASSTPMTDGPITVGQFLLAEQLLETGSTSSLSGFNYPFAGSNPVGNTVGHGEGLGNGTSSHTGTTDIMDAGNSAGSSSYSPDEMGRMNNLNSMFSPNNRIEMLKKRASLSGEFRLMLEEDDRSLEMMRHGNTEAGVYHNDVGDMDDCCTDEITPSTATTSSPATFQTPSPNGKQSLDHLPEAPFIIPLNEEVGGHGGGEDFHDSSDGGSGFMHGEKPAWGWDFVMTFVVPKTLMDELNPVEPNEDTNDRGAQEAASTQDDGNDDEEATEARGPSLLPGPGDTLVTLSSGSTSPEIEARKSATHTRERADILARLKSAGFVISQLLVPSEKTILVRFSLPERRLKEKAVHLGLRLQLTEEFGCGFLEYAPPREHAFVNQEKQEQWKCFFSPAERSKIIMYVLQSKEDWGCDLDVERLTYKQTVFQAFALHSVTERDDLVKKAVWARMWDPMWKPPLEELKDYFGARVTFYFVFVSFYARRLLALSLLSVIIFAVYRSRGDDVTWKCILLWIFAAVVLFWTTYFLENWKRRSAAVCQLWGLSEYRSDMVDDTRPQFNGEMRVGFYCEGGFVPVGDLLEKSMMEDLRVSDATSDALAAARRKGQARAGSNSGSDTFDLGDSPRKPTRENHISIPIDADTPRNQADTGHVSIPMGDVTPHNPEGQGHISIPMGDVSGAGAQSGGDAYTRLERQGTLRAVDLPRNAWEDPRVMRNARVTSAAVTTLFMLIMGGLTFVLLWFRTEISDFFAHLFNNDSFGAFMPGALNGVLITLFDPIWRSVSLRLTYQENHRTNQHFEDSLIYKRFAFQFISNYISLFYIAFLRPFADRKCAAGLILNDSGSGSGGVGAKVLCIRELEQQLMSLVITKATVGQVSELLMPFLMSSYKRLRAWMRPDLEQYGDVNRKNEDDKEQENESVRNSKDGRDGNNSGSKAWNVKNKMSKVTRMSMMHRMRSSHTSEASPVPHSPRQLDTNLSESAHMHSERGTSQRDQDTEPAPATSTLRDVASTSQNRYVYESNMAAYDSTLDDYNELVIQFGYICLFGIVFPPVCAIALLNNLVEVRTDAFKLLRLCQRPVADDAAGIGAWYVILEILNVLSVITNVGILVFTADSLTTLFSLDALIDEFWYRVLLRVVTFFLIEHILLGSKGLLALAIADVPSRTRRAIARQQFDIARFFNIGWQNAFRGVSLLKVDKREVNLCCEHADAFDRVSQDGNGS